MNSIVLDGGEYTSEGKKDIIDFVGTLVDAGLNTLTVSVPYIIRLVKKYYPQLNITASICAEIESPQRAKDFENIGVNCIVPAKDLNRDFSTLKNIVNSCSSSVKVLCTTPCLFKCSDLYYHMNLSSIRDNSLNEALKVKGKFLSHTASRCQRRRLEKLEEYIRSPWIRPEDISYYEKIGINDFKLDGRDKSEEYTTEVMTAYMNGHFDGNLLYLMQNYYPKNEDEFSRLNEFKDEFWRLGVYMDNNLLEGFIEAFVDGKTNCDKGCENCNYCKSWADKSIKLNRRNADDYLNLLIRTENENLTI